MRLHTRITRTNLHRPLNPATPPLSTKGSPSPPGGVGGGPVVVDNSKHHHTNVRARTGLCTHVQGCRPQNDTPLRSNLATPLPKGILGRPKMEHGLSTPQTNKQTNKQTTNHGKPPKNHKVAEHHGRQRRRRRWPRAKSAIDARCESQAAHHHLNSMVCTTTPLKIQISMRLTETGKL